MAGRLFYWVFTLASLLLGSFGAGNTGVFLVFSDIHYDPFYGTIQAMDLKCRGTREVFGLLGCDSPLALVNETLRAAREAYPSPDFIIFNGDLARHEMVALSDPKAAMNQVISNVSALFDFYFPNITRFGSPAVEAHHQVFFTLGNNDVLPGYALNLTSTGLANSTNTSVAMLQLLADDWAHELTPSEYETLAYGGYFSREVLPGLHVISINTVLYSSLHKPNTNTVADPNFQFTWLRNVLTRVRALGHHAYIVGHIPPTVSSDAYELMWWPSYIATYRALITDFCDVVSAQLYGHFHSEEFRALPDWCAPPLLLTASVSPVYDTNPSFRAVQFSRSSFALQDYCVHSAPINFQPLIWNVSHCALSQFSAASLTSKALYSAALTMSASCEALQPFLRIYMEGEPMSCGSASKWGCLLTTLTLEEFSACNSRTPASTGSSGPGVGVVGIVIAVILIVVIAAALALLFRWKPARPYERLKQPVDIDPSRSSEIIA